MNSEFIYTKILRLCDQPRTFQYISKNLDGLDPIKTKKFLEQLESEGKIKKRHDLWVVTEKSKQLVIDLSRADPHLYLRKYMGYFDFLKIPHPLDFEWRNSTASLNYLITFIQDINNVNDKILLLGMPTLFAIACIKDIPHKITLVERNGPIIEGLKRLNYDFERFNIIETDIFTVKPEKIGKYYFVLMDPPWYSPFFQQFMWLAAKCVEVGGIVGISLPPLNTKSGVLRKRLDWLSFCQEQGLCIENLYSQKLQYTMPFFEFNALRAAGVENILPFWRKGDLALFRKIGNKSSVRPAHVDISSEWTESEIDSIRIRFKISKSVKKYKNIIITHLVKGDILPTVSKSDHRREKANVWTSGNRIFKVNNIKQFVEIVNNSRRVKERLTEGQKLVTDWLDTIIKLEIKEHDEYLDWIYHEMERHID